MEFLNDVFSLWLVMLQGVVDDYIWSSLFWVVVLVITLLFVIKFWREIF